MRQAGRVGLPVPEIRFPGCLGTSDGLETVYLQRAVDHLRKHGREPTPADLVHLSPLGWEHINLTGDYAWETEQTIGPDQFRPLRTRSVDVALAA